MDCPNCGKKPVGFMGTFFLKGAGFKRAMQGFFRCKHCETLLIQDKNELGMPKFENPFWIAYSISLVVIIGIVWGGFIYIENSMGSEQNLLTIPVLIGVFILLYWVMDWTRVRYWIIRETTFEEHEKEMESQKLSTKGMIAFILFGIIAITSFLFISIYAGSLNLTPTVYSISAIVYMMIIILMAFGLMNYLSKTNAKESN